MNDWGTLLPTLYLAFWQTIEMVLVALVAGGLAGLVVGVLLYTTRPGNLLGHSGVFTALNVLVNIIRPIPFIIFLTFVQPLTRIVTGGNTIGTTAVIFPMALLATFAIARIVEQNLISVDPGVIEAARSMGASPLRIIRTVLIPEALAPLILGYTFIFIGIVDMSAMAGYVGGGGLGDFAIVYGYQAFNYSVTIVTVIIIVILVQGAQFLGNWLAKRVLHR